MTSKWLRKPPETPETPGNPWIWSPETPHGIGPSCVSKNTIWCILQDQAIAFVCENTVFLWFVFMLALLPGSSQFEGLQFRI